MSAVLDAGALVGVERRDRRVGALLRVLQRDGVDVLSSAGALAQVWRDGRRQANLARVLASVDIVHLTAISVGVGAAVQQIARRRGLFVIASPNRNTIARPLVTKLDEVDEIIDIYKVAVHESSIRGLASEPWR